MSLFLLALLAAPAPVEPGEDDSWLRAMPDDTDVVALIDVKRFMDSVTWRLPKTMRGRRQSTLRNA